MQRTIVAMRSKHPQAKVQPGLFTASQFLILKLRSTGLTQLQAAKQLGTSRANVSMIERRARNKLEKARATLRAYESILSTHSVNVEAGTRLQEIPSFVLHEGDRFGIHLKSNLIEIIRMVKSIKPVCIKDGKTTRHLDFTFTQSGKLSVA